MCLYNTLYQVESIFCNRITTSREATHSEAVTEKEVTKNGRDLIQSCCTNTLCIWYFYLTFQQHWRKRDTDLKIDVLTACDELKKCGLLYVTLRDVIVFRYTSRSIVKIRAMCGDTRSCIMRVRKSLYLCNNNWNTSWMVDKNLYQV